MQDTHTTELRADELREQFETLGLAMLATGDDDIRDDLLTSLEEVGSGIGALSGSATEVTRAKVAMSFFWARTCGGVGDLVVARCLAGMAGDLCGTFKAQVDEICERNGIREQWA